MENLNPFEIFDLSECSKRALNVARLRNMKEFVLEIDSISTQIRILRTDFKEAFGFTFNESKSMKSIRYLPSENPEEDFLDLLKKILNVFGIPQVQEFYSSDKNFKQFASISEILIQRKCEIGLMYFSVDKVEEEQLEHILNNLIVSDCFRFDTDFSFSPKFEYKPIKFPKVLSIENSSWFGLNQLFSAVKRCFAVTISNSSLTIRDLNEFLAKWMAGEIQNMTAFSISITSNNFTGDSPVLGMKPPIKGRWSKQLNHGFVCARVLHGHLIENINGQEALIKLIRGEFSFLTSTCIS
ncbi:unnamed protein product [Caenorhabditis nigoni]